LARGLSGYPGEAINSSELVSAASPETAAGGWLGTVITALAVVISIAVLAVLVSANMVHVRKLHTTRIQATIVPASGKLLGWNALDWSEWVPPVGREQVLVLFGVAEAGQTGDMAFWRDVVSHSRAEAPNIQFVGLCAPGGTCSLPRGSEGQLTLLKFMDPIQTHALAVSARQGLAFFFRGGQSMGPLPIAKDRQAFATQLADLSRKKTKEDGA
jgi:uncharacterized membrane protein YhaH (DUF805 family)